MFSIFTDAVVRGRESPENVGHLSAEWTGRDPWYYDIESWHIQKKKKQKTF